MSTTPTAEQKAILKRKLDLLATSPRVLLIATVPWCGHCKTMKGEIPKLAANLKATFTDADLVHLEQGDMDKSFMAKYKITGFPTITLLSNGVEVRPFRVGKRTAEHMLAFMTSTAIVPKIATDEE
jgi:thiol-disulfide isomerase/thioredoxin